MSVVRIFIDGQSYLSLEAISQCYECEITWLREAYEFGLLGGGVLHEDTLLLHVTVLDRVAEVVRLSRYQGLGFEAIVVLLGETSSWPPGSSRE
ncbi:MAG: hypothetical protein ABR538_16645 [Candidatus Binatia bacterium]